MHKPSRLKLDLALVRTLIDEMERGLDGNDGISTQLVEELSRLVNSLAKEIKPPASGERLLDVA
jgi:hypothetical protein